MNINSNSKESIDIILMDDLPVYKRIIEIKNRISEWNNRLEIPFDPDIDQLLLNRFEKKGCEYLYRYTIKRGVNELKRKL